MRKIRLLAIAAGLTSLAPAAVQAQPPRPDLRSVCGANAVFRKADLPPPALAALRDPMVDPGEPFQISDDIPRGPRLPFRRLICAEPTRDGYAVHFERGGRGYGTVTVYLKREADGTFVEEAPYGR